MSFPHLPYADAVASVLAEAGVPPELVHAGVDVDTGTLRARYEWPGGIRLLWTSTLGWRHEARHCGGPLLVGQFADPAVLVAIVRLLGGGQPPVSSTERWEHAQELDVDLAAWESAGSGRR